MTVLPKRQLGNTGLQTTIITLGGDSLGSMPQQFGNEVPEQRAVDVVTAAIDGGIRSFDTSNGYSAGESERRLGKALREYGALPEDLLVITKTDAKGSDYSGQRVNNSIAESIERLGLSYLPLLLLHDPEFHDFNYITQSGGAVDALVAARENGLVGHIGLAGGDTRVMSKYWDLGVFEVLLVHNRMTLVDQSGVALVNRALGDGAGILNAAVNGGGALTDPVRVPGMYAYAPAPAETLAAIEKMRQVCREYGTDLGTAAVRFSTRDPRFASTIVGLSDPAKVKRTIRAATAELPPELWSELAALMPVEQLWLDQR